MCIITLTRIFLLTRSYPALLRETTTPNLPGFITSCLNLIALKSHVPEEARQIDVDHPCLAFVLDAFCKLLPYHPTLFRPLVVQLRSMLALLLAPTPSTLTDGDGSSAIHSGQMIAPRICESARDLYVLLHYSAPKNTAADEWLVAFKEVVSAVHSTTDRVCRAVIEDWESTAGRSDKLEDPRAFEQTVNHIDNTFVFPGWSGIHAGTERLIGLLDLLQRFLIMPTSSSVRVPAGLVMDLTTRLLSLTVPSTQESNSWQGSVRLNPQISRDEREGLWLGLPGIHISVMKVMSALVHRLQHAFIPAMQRSLEQLVWVFDAEAWTTYVALSLLCSTPTV